MLLRRRDSLARSSSLAAADLAGWKIPARQRLYARSEPESVSPVGRAVHITAFVARSVSLPVQHAAWRFFTRLLQLGNGFLSRLVEIAEISL